MTSQNGSIDGKELVTAANGVGRPDPEVPERLERARRRQFPVGYKLRVLREGEAARATGGGGEGGGGGRGARGGGVVPVASGGVGAAARGRDPERAESPSTWSAIE